MSSAGSRETRVNPFSSDSQRRPPCETSIEGCSIAAAGAGPGQVYPSGPGWPPGTETRAQNAAAAWPLPEQLVDDSRRETSQAELVDRTAVFLGQTEHADEAHQELARVVSARAEELIGPDPRVVAAARRAGVAGHHPERLAGPVPGAVAEVAGEDAQRVIERGQTVGALGDALERGEQIGEALDEEAIPVEQQRRIVVGPLLRRPRRQTIDRRHVAVHRAVPAGARPVPGVELVVDRRDAEARIFLAGELEAPHRGDVAAEPAR